MLASRFAIVIVVIAVIVFVVVFCCYGQEQLHHNFIHLIIFIFVICKKKILYFKFERFLQRLTQTNFPPYSKKEKKCSFSCPESTYRYLGVSISCMKISHEVNCASRRRGSRQAANDLSS